MAMGTSFHHVKTLKSQLNYRIIIKKRLEATKKDCAFKEKDEATTQISRRAHSQYTQISRPPNDQSANWKITL